MLGDPDYFEGAHLPVRGVIITPVTFFGLPLSDEPKAIEQANQYPQEAVMSSMQGG